MAFLCSVPLLIYMGFANAGLTLVGQQTGANSPKQARRTGVLCLCFSLAVCVGIANLTRFLWGKPVAAVK